MRAGWKYTPEELIKIKTTTSKTLSIIGGGLAGAEAAWQAAERGVQVNLFEMRPMQKTPAHHTDLLAELVCSNSLRARSLHNAVGLLKEELRRLGSLIVECADRTEVPAGGALAVDREQFAALVTDKVKGHPNISVFNGEVTEIPPERPLIIATGPLTSDALAGELFKLLGQDYLYFYDAAAPIVTAESINYDRVFRASRYGRHHRDACGFNTSGSSSAAHTAAAGPAGDDDLMAGDYLNCPMSEEEYTRFWEALVAGEKHISHLEEEEKYFEGCMPVEEMASRGKDTLLFGPLKPVGLTDPRTGEQAYAVVQLRQDNREATLYNMVGFQTQLRRPEQKRIIQMIPGLENVEFARYGMMHRNTFINAPGLINSTYELTAQPGVFIAGQLSGVEGYVESTASGLIAGINAYLQLSGQEPVPFPRETAAGALGYYIAHANPASFQPMNVNFGMIPPPEEKIPKKMRREYLANRSLQILEQFLSGSLWFPAGYGN